MTLKELRAQLAPYRTQSLRSALARVAIGWTVYAATFWGAVTTTSIAARLLCGLVAGLFTGNLFMIGHDACHGSFTSRPPLNRVLGRIAFLPCYHAYSLWERSHNRVHHVFTNLKGHDFVWAPLSKPEFDALPAWRRVLYRFYRTPVGFPFHYSPEIWWPWVVGSILRAREPRRASYTLDRLLVVAFAAAQATVIALEGGGMARAWALAFLFAVVVPWLVFSWLIGFVIYFNHTHPAVPWFRNRSEWSPFAGMVVAGVRLRFPQWSLFFASNIMDHVAHHVDPRVPLARLRGAQDRIDELLPGQIVVQPWSIGALLDVMRRCKLYDYDAHCWIDYGGRPTTACNLPAKPPLAESQLTAA